MFVYSALSDPQIADVIATSQRVASDIAAQFESAEYDSSLMTKSVKVAEETHYYAAYATFGLAMTSAGYYLMTKKTQKAAIDAGDFTQI